MREAAYLRMIFAQQFMVDALGMHFSATVLVGGETFVRQEVAKLQAATYQFEQGEIGVTEALGRMVGNGCYVSDFFTQTEWGLLSRMAEQKEVAQHHTATRLSYLDINSANDVPRQQALAGRLPSGFSRRLPQNDRYGWSRRPASGIRLRQHASRERLGSGDGCQHAANALACPGDG